MSSSLRIVVTGLAATYPFGGVFWDYIQYPLGFLRLGHDVLYLEDTGKWCYDPERGTFVESGEANAAILARHLERLDPALAGRWHYRDATGREYGLSRRSVSEFCSSADLLLHVSASCLLRDEHLGARTVAFIDSDPLYTQAGLMAAALGEGEAEGLEWWTDRHQVFFSFGENVGRPGCKVPSVSIDWQPTRQPVVLDCFETAVVPPSERRRVVTTVASWEPTEKGPVVDGVGYSGKSTEFLRLLDLPARSPLPLEIALSGPAPTERLREKGWRVIEGLSVSRDPWTYRDYLARSRAECGVAKHAYVASRSGWFSCRSACYLALGVPVVAQDTGFGEAIPAGEGLLMFATPEEAAAALREVDGDYERHARAAAQIAREYFDSDKVLTRLLDRIAASR